MSVLLQLRTFAAIAIGSGGLLLIKPTLVLRSPLEPYLRSWTGLPSTPLEPLTLAVGAIPIIAIGVIYCAAMITGDEKLVRFSGMLRHLGNGVDGGSAGSVVDGITYGVFLVLYGYGIDGDGHHVGRGRCFCSLAWNDDWFYRWQGRDVARFLQESRLKWPTLRVLGAGSVFSHLNCLYLDLWIHVQTMQPGILKRSPVPDDYSLPSSI
jgi:hypothetical protein